MRIAHLPRAQASTAWGVIRRIGSEQLDDRDQIRVWLWEGESRAKSEPFLLYLDQHSTTVLAMLQVLLYVRFVSIRVRPAPPTEQWVVSTGLGPEPPNEEWVASLPPA